MAYTPTHQTPASSFAAAESFHALLARYEAIAHEHDILFTPLLLLELQAFVQRNRILAAFDIAAVPEEDVCPDCLKAHLLAQADKHGIPPRHQKLLKRKVPGSLGHQGYYLDGEEVRTILS